MLQAAMKTKAESDREAKREAMEGMTDEQMAAAFLAEEVEQVESYKMWKFANKKKLQPSMHWPFLQIMKKSVRMKWKKGRKRRRKRRNEKVADPPLFPTWIRVTRTQMFQMTSMRWVLTSGRNTSQTQETHRVLSWFSARKYRVVFLQENEKKEAPSPVVVDDDPLPGSEKAKEAEDEPGKSMWWTGGTCGGRCQDHEAPCTFVSQCCCSRSSQPSWEWASPWDVGALWGWKRHHLETRGVGQAVASWKRHTGSVSPLWFRPRACC